jgi:glutaryl-CoA dehydrogenase
MDGVEVGEDALLPNVEGLKGPFGCLNRARYGISWGVMGAAEACWHAARQYGLDRKQFGRRSPRRSCSRKSWPTCRPKSRSACKARCARRAPDGRGHNRARNDLARQAQQLRQGAGHRAHARDMHGGNGISRSIHVMRHMANLETVNTYEGTHDVHALILGRAQTGLQAFFARS